MGNGYGNGAMDFVLASDIYIVPQSLVVENFHIYLDKKTIYKYLFMPCSARLNPFVSISAQ